MIFNFNQLKLIPNILSSFRLLLIIPVIYIFENVQNLELRNNLLIFIIIIAFISDISDGFIARKFNQISDLGKIIDPVADKSLVATFVIFFWKNNLIPNYYFILILLRDIFILIGGLFISKKSKIIVMSDIIGKLTVFFIGLFFLIILLNNNQNTFIYKFLLILSSIMCFISLLNYFIKSFKLLKS